MARLNSFYLDPDQWPGSVGETVCLKGAEVKHMVTVLRTSKDQTVRLFDGKGGDGLFSVIETNRNQALLKSVELKEHPAPTAGLTLAIGWGKSKRRNYLFEKTVELGGAGIIFWQAARSQGQVPTLPKDTWKEKCIQAAKQCGAVHLPTIDTVDGIPGLVNMALGFDSSLLAWESGTATTPLSPNHLSKGRTLIVIGPEGGFDDTEAAQLQAAGCVPVTLGSSILRWETAATYCLSLASYAVQGMP